MKGHILTQKHILDFSEYLDMEEKSPAIREKYLRDVRRFMADSNGSPVTKELAQLADVLGHSSVNTTRIYIMSTGEEHRRRIERMGLVIP